jgi:uncharacterized membrane protein YfcA
MKSKSLLGGVSIGTLGGLIGLGGAEFRLPFLVGILKIDTFHAIMLNIVISLVTVSFALLFRGFTEAFYANFHIVLNLLSGSLIGAYLGANFASKIDKTRLNHSIFILLVFLSFILFSHIFFEYKNSYLPPLYVQLFLGFILGIAIGAISSLLGVAGGELLIPAIILLYGMDIKTAGTLSLAISLPTLLMGIYQYNKNEKLKEIFGFKEIMVFMAIGSILGAFLGVLLFGVVDDVYLELLLGTILLISAYKLFNKSKKI